MTTIQLIEKIEKIEDVNLREILTQLALIHPAPIPYLKGQSQEDIQITKQPYIKPISDSPDNRIK